jgi:hypothetical protein
MKDTEVGGASGRRMCGKQQSCDLRAEERRVGRGMYNGKRGHGLMGREYRRRVVAGRVCVGEEDWRSRREVQSPVDGGGE